MTTSPRALVLSLLLLAPASRADVLVVDDDGGPGVFTTIQAAVDAAVDGDTILVRSGLYQTFLVSNRSLAIQGDAGADVVVNGFVRVHNLSAERWVSVAGLDVRTPAGQGTPAAREPRLDVQNCLGAVWFTDVLAVGLPGIDFGFVMPGPEPAAEVRQSSRVTVVRCTLQGGWGASNMSGAPALWSVDSAVFLHDSLLTGGASSCVALGASCGDGGDGAWIQGGFVYAEASTLVGGFGMFQVFPLPFAFGTGGAGLLVQGTDVPGTLTDCTLTGGSGLVSGAALEIVGSAALLQPAGLSRDFAASTPVREGEILELSWSGTPGEGTYVFVDSVPLSAYVPSVLAPLHALPTILLGPFAALPAGGTETLQVVVPLLDAGLEGGTIFLQGVLYLNGALYLADPSPLTVLDANL